MCEQSPPQLDLDLYVNGSPPRTEAGVRELVNRLTSLNLDGATPLLTSPWRDQQGRHRVRTRWDLRLLQLFDVLLRASGLRFVGLFWLDHRRQELERFTAYAEELLNSGVRLHALELDAEEAWLSGTSAQVADSARYLKDWYERLLQEWDKPWKPPELWVTAVPNLHPDVRTLLDTLGDLCTLVRLQWYTFRRPAHKGFHWSHKGGGLKPGQHQKLWAGLAKKEGLHGERLAVGLASYWQKELLGYEGQVERALEESLLETLNHTHRLVYWAYSFLFASDAPHSEAVQLRSFLSTLKRDYTRYLVAQGEKGWKAEQDEVWEPPSNKALHSRLQHLLVCAGYDLGKYGPQHDGVDGVWGSATDAAAEAFEKESGWTHSPGPGYYRSLYEVLLERWRKATGSEEPDWEDKARKLEGF